MKKKGNEILFNFIDLTYEEFFNILNKISITAYQEKLKINSQRAFAEMEELKGYRIQKLTKEKLVPALIKYSKKSNSTVYALLVEMVNKYCAQIGIRALYDQYFESKNIDELNDNLYKFFNEKKIASDVKPWIKMVKHEDHIIPENIKEVSILEKNVEIIETKSELSNKDKIEIKRLEKEIHKLEEKIKKNQTSHKQTIVDLEKEITICKENGLQLFNQYFERILVNITNISDFDFNLQLKKLVNSNKITNFDQLWIYLSKLENEYMKKTTQDYKEKMLDILAIKYALLEGKED